MTHTDFNQLLSSIKACRRTRCGSSASSSTASSPSREAARSAARQDGQTRQRPHRLQKKPLIHRRASPEDDGAASSPACPIPPSTSTTTIPRISRSPSRASRCRKPSSASGAEVAHRLLRRFQRPGQALRPGNRHRLGAPPHAPQPFHGHLHRPHHRRRSHLAVARRRKGTHPLAASAHRRSSAASASISPRRYTVIEVTPALLDEAMRLANAHTPSRLRRRAARRGPRSQPQATRHDGFAPVTLISADQALNAAATAEGLTVDDPNRHP